MGGELSSLHSNEVLLLVCTLCAYKYVTVCTLAAAEIPGVQEILRVSLDQTAKGG